MRHGFWHMREELRHMRDEHGGWHGLREKLHRGFGGRGGHGGGRRRMFDAGELRLVLLALMETQPRHGYDLIREIEARTGGAYAPSPGIVYPTLTMLEEIEQIQAVASEGAKRAFTLTPIGIAYLSEHKAAAEAALKRLEALRAEGGQIDTGPVRRAMQNLKAALEQRLAGIQDKQTLFDAADLIDEAARKIERLP